MKKSLVCLCLFGTAAAFAVPVISNLKIMQDASRRVRVAYSLSEAAIVAAEFVADGVPVGDEHLRTGLSGDIFTPVAAGECAFSWDARKAWPDRTVSEFSVRLTPIALSAAPTWMVIDLVNGETRYYERESQLAGGSASDIAYKTTHILLKRMKAAGVPWRMGGIHNLTGQGGRWQNPHLVTLTEDFYCAVYELTQAQANRFCTLPEQKWTGDLLPAHNITYEELRGGSDVADWPKHGHFVAEGSVLDLLRDRCGQPVDILTEAQWCFANGAAEDPRRIVGGGWTDSNGKERMAELAWTSENSDYVLHDVAGKSENLYGLYDMHGNGGEFVLDWCQTVMSPASVIDPAGPESLSVNDGVAEIETYGGSGTESVGRAYCGGHAGTAWYYATTSYRNWSPATSRSVRLAVRLGAPGTVVVTERNGDGK